MISERGYDTEGGAKWFRDPEKQLAPNEITRFPHAVLEVKLELGGKFNIIDAYILSELNKIILTNAFG
jgi:SPX domain protein involved in polyphosphate accumulation